MLRLGGMHWGAASMIVFLSGSLWLCAGCNLSDPLDNVDPTAFGALDASGVDGSDRDAEDPTVGDPSMLDGGTDAGRDDDRDATRERPEDTDAFSGDDRDSGGSSETGTDGCDRNSGGDCACTYDPTETNDVDTDDSHDEGVCRGQSREPNDACSRPAAYEDAEKSCSDGVDNDCDGSVDRRDPDCRKPAGRSCTKDAECLGQCEPFSGTTERVCTHRIFVSSKSWPGDLGGLRGADRKCNRLATAEGLGGDWRAVLSATAVHARDRISIAGRVHNLNGTRIANNASDLWDTEIDAPVRKDETNSDRDTLVWTGTLENGTWDGANGESDPDDCGGSWVTASPREKAEVGDSTARNGEWLANARGHSELVCNRKLAIYCVDGQ